MIIMIIMIINNANNVMNGNTKRDYNCRAIPLLGPWDVLSGVGA